MANPNAQATAKTTRDGGGVLSRILGTAAAVAQEPTTAGGRRETSAAAYSEIVIANVNDYQRIARRTVPKSLYEYLASGTDDEQTLSENRSAFKGWYLRPRVMRPVGSLSSATTLFGRRMSLPVFVSPAGVHALCDPVHGEIATARACGRVGTVFGVSQHSTRTIEDVARGAEGGTDLWYQSYILKDRELTLRLVKRAKKAGYKGVFLTVDSVRFGYREADARNGFNALPPPHRLVNYDEVPSGTSSSAFAGSLDRTYNGKAHKSWDQNSELMFEQNVTWDDVKWLKQHGCSSLPLVVKGVMTAEDARSAVEAGADGVMVSNHGGRQLDGCLASIDALPEVVAAVGHRVPVLLDGGVTRGTDVLKALALGATAVGIGKPVFFALAVGGEDAVVNMLGLMKTEVEAAMAICGCRTVEDLAAKGKGGLVCRHPSGGPAMRYVRSKL